MKNYYFTFGSNHPHPITGEAMQNSFVTICAHDSATARELMFKRYGVKWSMQYTDKDFQPHFFPLGSYELIRPEISLDDLKSMERGEIIAYGKVTDSRLFVEEVKWIAKRGSGIPDWAIYYQRSSWSLQRVLETGDKVVTDSVIKELVPCTAEAFDMYRY